MLYGDYKETTPGALDEFVAGLRQHAGQNAQPSSPKGGQPPSAKGPSGPASAHKGGSHPPGGPSGGVGGGGGAGGAGSPNVPTPQNTSKPNPSTQPPQREALQLCIETGKYSVKMNELEVNQPHQNGFILESDGMFFERIRIAYQTARHSMLPMRLRFRKPKEVIFVKVRSGTTRP
jgi:hypothetical protein